MNEDTKELMECLKESTGWLETELESMGEEHCLAVMARKALSMVITRNKKIIKLVGER